MLGLVLILVAVLQFEGTSGGELHLCHRAGDDVVLPCNSPSSSYSCSIVNWFYTTDAQSTSPLEVMNGNIVQSSPRAVRLNMDTNCSLIINNITAEDAGRYICRPGSHPTLDGSVSLSVLTISPSALNADPRKEDVTLDCSLWRYSGLGSCPENSFRWLDERGAELTGEDVGYSLRRPRSCVSSLTVQHLSGTNRRFTCQVVIENTLKVEAHYTPVLKVHIYHRAGEDAVLPCRRPSSSSSCSSVNWFYKRTEDMNSQPAVQKGIIVQSSSRAARLSLDHNCSLIINIITAEDAGRYSCQILGGVPYDTDVYLNMMSISPSPPNSDPTKEEKITLHCSLHRYTSLGPCPDKSLLWVDETGTELLGEGVGYKFRQTGCDSYLTVKLRSSSSRRYTCRFFEGNTVKIEAHYGSESEDPGTSTSTIIILGAVIGVLLLLVVLAAVFVKLKKTRVKENHKPRTEDQDSSHENHPYDETQSDLTYATVSHSKTSPKITVKQDEDTVTYSAVRTREKT